MHKNLKYKNNCVLLHKKTLIMENIYSTESEVLERISNEVGQINQDVKASHSSGHSSSNGHWSSTYGSLKTENDEIFSTESEVLERIYNEVGQINQDIKAAHSSGHGSSNGHWSSTYGSLKTGNDEVFSTESEVLERISNEVGQINQDIKAAHSSGHGSSNGHWSSTYGSLKQIELNELFNNESEVLNKLSDSAANGTEVKAAHTSGHSSSNGHWSSVYGQLDGSTSDFVEESDVLNQIIEDLYENDKVIKAAHTSGHSSSNGHWSSVYGKLELIDNNFELSESEVLERINNDLNKSDSIKAAHTSGHSSSNGHWSSVYGQLK